MNEYRTNDAQNAGFLSLLLDSYAGMAFHCRNDADWTLEYVSTGCAVLTGYSADELLKRRAITYEMMTAPQDREMVRAAIGRVAPDNEYYEVEYRIQRKDGCVRWVREQGRGLINDAGQVIGLTGFISDVTERKKIEQDLIEAERRYRSIYENAIEGIYQSRLEGSFITVNPALARIYGYDSTELLILSLRDLSTQLYVDPKRRTQFIDLIMRVGSVSDFQSRVYRRDGSIIWISENARLVYDEQQRPLYFEGTVEDITARKQYEHQIERRALHDPLTDLPNRTLLQDRLEHALLDAKRNNTLVAVAFIDLDQFKYINDSLGHQSGDELLLTVARRLKSAIREADTVARQGGDEFVLVLTGHVSESEVAQVIERVMASLTRPWLHQEQELVVTCSIGVSLSSPELLDAKTLLRNADAAMYRAKEMGRNNFQFFRNEMTVNTADRLDLMHNMRKALERQEFQLYYQPKINLDSGQMEGAEALMRWIHPEKGMISPAQFIPVAEETGLIILMGEWGLWTACEQAKLWQEQLQEQGLPPISVAVNLSPRQLQQADLVSLVQSILEQTGLAPNLLELEITESLLMQNVNVSIERLTALKQMGVKLSFDDFGTGYSSLNYLKKFPVDCLKIDQSFIRDILDDPDDAAIVKAMITLGHILNLSVVAEGVETVDQADFLSLNGCDYVQGYYYSRPLEVSAFTKLLLKK